MDDDNSYGTSKTRSAADVVGTAPRGGASDVIRGTAPLWRILPDRFGADRKCMSAEQSGNVLPERPRRRAFGRSVRQLADLAREPRNPNAGSPALRPQAQGPHEAAYSPTTEFESPTGRLQERVSQTEQALVQAQTRLEGATAQLDAVQAQRVSLVQQLDTALANTAAARKGWQDSWNAHQRVTKEHEQCRTGDHQTEREAQARIKSLEAANRDLQGRLRAAEQEVRTRPGPADLSMALAERDRAIRDRDASAAQAAGLEKALAELRAVEVLSRRERDSAKVTADQEQRRREAELGTAQREIKALLQAAVKTDKVIATMQADAESNRLRGVSQAALADLQKQMTQLGAERAREQSARLRTEEKVTALQSELNTTHAQLDKVAAAERTATTARNTAVRARKKAEAEQHAELTRTKAAEARVKDASARIVELEAALAELKATRPASPTKPTRRAAAKASEPVEKPDVKPRAANFYALLKQATAN